MTTTVAEIDVGETASDFAAKVRRAAQKAANEEELRIEMETAIRQMAADLDMDVDPENERTVVSGRPDAVYGDLIIEYKDPNHPGDWADEALHGRNEDDRGLIDYMYDIATSEAHDEAQQELLLDRMVGVGTNGYKIFFCRYQPNQRVKPIVEEQTPLTGMSRSEATSAIERLDVHTIEDGARMFLTYLRSLHRKPLTAEKLAADFGPSGDVAKAAVNEFYSALTDSLGTHPRVSTLYNEWDRVFGIVYGEEMGQIQDDKEAFGSIYDVEEPEVRPLLFSVHTYYALLKKSTACLESRQLEVVL